MSLPASKFHFPKAMRLLKRREFHRLNYGKRLHGSFVIIDVKSNKNSITRLGVTVSRHFGKSHERNRFKRLVRESFRLCRQLLPFQIDMNVKPRPPAKQASMQDIMQDILNLLRE